MAVTANCCCLVTVSCFQDASSMLSMHKTNSRLVVAASDMHHNKNQ